MNQNQLAIALEKLYRHFNKRELIAPDPLEWVHHYSDQANQEIAALIASSLAYGNVTQILISLKKIFSLLGESPHQFILENKGATIRKKLNGFKHRWHTGDDIAGLLASLGKIYKTHGTLLAFFLEFYKPNQSDLNQSLEGFITAIKQNSPIPIRENLLPNPALKSACKRLHMFLRWMVRYDAVDTGLWRVIPASKLIMPIDTHIHQISLAIGLTNRKIANLETAIEITNKFKKISSEDPVRYDFCLARLGINRSTSVKLIRSEFLKKMASLT